MKTDSKRSSLADQLIQGLEESIAHSRGEIALRTTVVEIPDRPPAVDAAAVTRLRTAWGLTPAAFAALLNVSVRTVLDWENGARAPSQAALRLLQLLENDPEAVLRAVGLPTVKKIGPNNSASNHQTKPKSLSTRKRPKAKS
jgi:putative transcriptional regulator